MPGKQNHERGLTPYTHTHTSQQWLMNRSMLPFNDSGLSHSREDHGRYPGNEITSRG